MPTVTPEFLIQQQDKAYRLLREAFLDSEEDIQWLFDTHLKGVPLPTWYAHPGAAVMQGNQDAPFAVNLYRSSEPLYTDDYLRITFHHDAPVSWMQQEYDGRTDQPKGSSTHG